MNRRVWLVTFVIVMSWVSTGLSIFMPASYLPTDRLITNTEAYIDKNPNEPKGYYLLARIHYLAFINKATAVPGFENNNPLPSVIPYWQYAADFEYAMRFQQAQQLLLSEWGYKFVDDVPWDQRSDFDQAVRAREAELRDQGWKPDTLNNAQVLAHAILSHVNFEKAMDLDPENGLYFLGLASLL
ncbi:MAG: hypothetical protein GY809_08260, partial [Planctomycetes bacterium]|nr:hypothetical protein [Planctomycetota bacterium]